MNRTLFREGECDVAAEERVEDVRARAHLVWRGENTFWDYVYEKEIAIPRPEGPEPAMSTVQARMIEGPGVFMWYNSRASLARMHKRERRGSGYPSILELRPDQAWFGMDEPFGTRPNWNWHSLFDPGHGVEYLAKVVVRPETGERVVFERHYKGGSLLRVEASLAHGANVIAYETDPPASAGDRAPDAPMIWNRGRYEWAQDGDGNWYPTHFEFQRSSAGGPKQLAFDFSLDIAAFNPHPEIPRDRFQFSSLAAAPGTLVEEVGSDGATTRTYRLGRDGKEETKLGQSLLDDIAERLREGFADPDRDQK